MMRLLGYGKIGLRAILRQDPDIVMVGEIRDVETAKIAIQASLTLEFKAKLCIPK